MESRASIALALALAAALGLLPPLVAAVRVARAGPAARWQGRDVERPRHGSPAGPGRR